MAGQFIYTMHKVGKFIPPNRDVIKDITLSFFPGAKIGVLGPNGAGKSTPVSYTHLTLPTKA